MGDPRARLIFTVGLDEYRCASLAFSPDGTLLAAGRSNGMVGLWRVGDGRLLRHFLHDLLGHAVCAVAFSADATYLASAGGHHLVVRDLRTGRPVWKRQHPAELSAVAFGPAGECVATACADGTLRTWTVRGRLAREVPGGCGAGAVEIGFRADGVPEARAVAGRGDGVRAVTADGRLRATATDGELQVWAVDAGVLESYRGSGGSSAGGAINAGEN